MKFIGVIMKINKAILSLLLPILLVQPSIAAPKKSKIPKRVANVTRKLRLNTLAIKKLIRQYKKPLMYGGVGVCALAITYLGYKKYYGKGATWLEEEPKTSVVSKFNPRNWGKKTDNTSQDDSSEATSVLDENHIEDDSSEATSVLDENHIEDDNLEPQEKITLFQKGKAFWKGKKIIRNKNNSENQEDDNTN